jgi:hypothetical protein
MSDDFSSPKKTPQIQKLSPWQFSLRRMFAATTVVAIVFSIAAWGGWAQYDAPAYLAILFCAAVFSANVRQAILGVCVIVVVFILSLIVFIPSRDGEVLPFLCFFALSLYASAFILRMENAARLLPLIASLILTEAIFAMTIIYSYDNPTVFHAFCGEHRGVYIQIFRDRFINSYHLFLIVPWLAGVGCAEIITRWKLKMRSRQLRHN